jgi:Ca2+-binding EF-hand superfamily protein
MARIQARRERALAAFRRFDTDGSGYIDRMEFHQALLALGVVRAQSEAVAVVQSSSLFVAADANGDGALSLEEFALWYTDAEDKAEAERERDGRAHKLFVELAAESGGQYIAKSQFWNALLRLGMFDGLTVEQAVDKVNEQYALADVDNSGVLDAPEFTRYYSLMEGVQTLKRQNSSHVSPGSSAPGSPGHGSFLTAHSPPARAPLRMGLPGSGPMLH